MKSSIKNLILKSIVLPFAFSGLAACSESKDESGVVVWRDKADPNSSWSAESFLTDLQKSENRLANKYGFYVSQGLNAGITHTPLTQIDFRRLAAQQKTSVQIVKAQLLEDVFYFALNYEILKNNEDSLRAANNRQYNLYVSKTYELGKEFSLKRIEFYNKRFKKLNRSLRTFGFKLETVINSAEIRILLPSIEHNTLHRQSRKQLRLKIQESKDVCKALKSIHDYKGVFNGNGVSLEACSEEKESIVFFINHLNLPHDRQGGFSLQNILILTTSYTNSKLSELHKIANVFLIDNEIILSENSASGIDGMRRRAWEYNIRRLYVGNASWTVEGALKNNFYENLNFKRLLIKLSLDLDPSLFPQGRQRNEKILDDINRILSTSSYPAQTDIDVGTSPESSGFLFEY